MKKNMEVGNLNGSGLASWCWILEELMVVMCVTNFGFWSCSKGFGSYVVSEVLQFSRG